MRLSPLLVASLSTLLLAAPRRVAQGQFGTPSPDMPGVVGPYTAGLRVAVETTGAGAEAARAPHASRSIAAAPTSAVAAGGAPSFWKHTGMGLLLGTAVGLGTGLYFDARGACWMMYCSVVAVPVGAIAGTLTGVTVWAVRRANQSSRGGSY